MTSYGGLIVGQSKEDFFSCSSMPRNRELMRAFKDVGLVEQLGSGMSRILKAYDRTVFEISEHFIKVTFPFSSATTENGTRNGTVSGATKSSLEKREATAKAILEIVREMPAVTLDQLAEKLQCGRRTVSRLIKELQDAGKLKRIGSNKTGCWVVEEI